MKVLICMTILLLSGAAQQSSPEQSPDALLGTWIAEDGSHIKVERCGAGYCGRTVFVTEKKNQKSLNKLAFKDMIHQKDKMYGQGVFIDPSNDNEYKGKIIMADADNLQIRITALLGISYSEKWKRKK